MTRTLGHNSKPAGKSRGGLGRPTKPLPLDYGEKPPGGPPHPTPRPPGIKCPVGGLKKPRTRVPPAKIKRTK
jgi:hypothetical protein